MSEMGFVWVIKRVWAYLFLVLLLSLVTAQDAMLPSGETVGQWAHFDRMALWALCLVLLVLLAGRKGQMPDFPAVLSFALMTWGGVEAVIGLRQLFGFAASGHSLYAMTGSFFNPGPYSGYLAMVLPVCVHEYLAGKAAGCRWRIIFAGGVALLLLCVLPAGMSRSAWLAAAVACLWVYGCHEQWGRKLRQLWTCHRAGMLAVAALLAGMVLLAGVGMFRLKPDSARGRLLMWRMSCRTVAEEPWTGHGAGSFAAAYGEAQETYFAENTYSEWEERVAGSPEYAFNEYLQAAVERGIPVAVGALLVAVVCWWAGFRKRRYGICGGLLALGIFAFSSYPLQLPVFVVTSLALLAGCVVGRSKAGWLTVGVLAALWGGARWEEDRQTAQACREWMNARVLYHAGAYFAAEEEYEKLYPWLRTRAAFLFEYGHGLHKQGKWNESNGVLQEAMEHSCDPMILNVMGKNLQAQGRYAEAETCYWRSIHRLPGRIYPYYLLVKLYAEPDFCQPEKLAQVGQVVLAKEPKVPSTAVREMKEEVKEMMGRLTIDN